MSKETQKALDVIKEQLELLQKASKETSDSYELVNLTNAMAELISAAKTLIRWKRFVLFFHIFHLLNNLKHAGS